MFVIAAAFGLGPFALIQCARGMRSLALVSCGMLGLIAFAWYGVNSDMTNEATDGPATVLAAGLVFLAGCSAIAGIVTRAITLVMAVRRKRFMLRAVVTLAGLLLIPAIIYAPKALHAWNNRPPSSGCSIESIRFSVGGTPFTLPGIALVSAILGNGKLGARSEAIYFHGNAGFRKYCDLSVDGRAPVAVNAINLRLEEAPREVRQPQFVERCGKAQWPPEICDGVAQSRLVGIPAKIAIYADGQIAPGYFGGGRTYERITAAKAKANGPSDVASFSYDGTHSYYWIDTEPDAVTGVPFAVECFDAHHNALYCMADEVLAGTVRVSYAGRISRTDPIADARSLRRTVWKMVDALRETGPKSAQ